MSRRSSNTATVPPLRLRLSKSSDTRHGFSYRRADGSGESLELETRSFLVHDLTHFALESAAKLRGGFYGALAAGTAYGALADAGMEGMSGEVLAIEMVVGPLSGALRGDIDAEDFTARLAASFTDLGREVPPWLTVETIAAAAARFKALMGQWKATPFGAVMELCFEPSPESCG